MVLSEPRAMAKHIEPGMRVALPVDYAGVSMAMTRPIIEHGAGNLDLVCVPTGGLQVDQLVGAGLVRTVETSAVSLGEAGGAPRFNAAVKEGAVRLKDATCPAIHAGLIAAQKGSPFMPLRGLIGTDLLRHRDDWRVVDNPLADGGDPIVMIPPSSPTSRSSMCPWPIASAMSGSGGAESLPPWLTPRRRFSSRWSESSRRICSPTR